MLHSTVANIRRLEIEDIGERITRGAIAGIVAGLVFLIATMGYVTTQGKPAVAPMIDISTIFHGQDQPVPSSDNVVIGLVTHLTLSIAFGVVFGLLALLIPRRAVIVLSAGVVYGLLLYVVNFQIFGRTLFPWFTDPNGPDQGFEVLIHAVFGLVLAPFLIGRTQPAGAHVREADLATTMR